MHAPMMHPTPDASSNANSRKKALSVRISANVNTHTHGAYTTPSTRALITLGTHLSSVSPFAQLHVAIPARPGQLVVNCPGTTSNDQKARRGHVSRHGRDTTRILRWTTTDRSATKQPATVQVLRRGPVPSLPLRTQSLLELARPTGAPQHSVLTKGRRACILTLLAHAV